MPVNLLAAAPMSTFAAGAYFPAIREFSRETSRFDVFRRVAVIPLAPAYLDKTVG